MILSCLTCSTRPIFARVFIGIETPRVASLNETKKFQNVAGDDLDSKLARIQNSGIDISAGFIVGFDNDDESIFEDQFRFIQDNGIVLAMVGMLTAIPKTPLYERLRKDGRLRLHDFNCNFVPKNMTPERLQSGYWELLRRLYAPEAFLERYFKIYNYPEFRRRRAAIIARANEGKTSRTLDLRANLDVEPILGAGQGKAFENHGNCVLAFVHAAPPAVPKRDCRLHAIRQSLRGTLAFLEIHRRRYHRKAAHV